MLNFVKRVIASRKPSRRKFRCHRLSGVIEVAEERVMLSGVQVTTAAIPRTPDVGCQDAIIRDAGRDLGPIANVIGSPIVGTMIGNAIGSAANEGADATQASTANVADVNVGAVNSQPDPIIAAIAGVIATVEQSVFTDDTAAPLKASESLSLSDGESVPMTRITKPIVR